MDKDSTSSSSKGKTVCDSKVLDKILALIEDEKNIFIHGPGGVGKTVLMTSIASILISKGIKVYCTATTGIAAVNLSSEGIIAQTLHSWGGIGLGVDSVEKLVKSITNTNFKAKRRWENVVVLIIDESPMLGESTFEKLDSIAKEMRGCKKPFGGIILILGGDFMQLRPIKERWIFESEKFKALKLHYFNLTKPKRYDEPEYFDFLLRLRMGNHTPEDISLLNQRHIAYKNLMKVLQENKASTCVIPTVLFSKRVPANEYNKERLDALEGETIQFKAVDKCVPKKKNQSFDCDQKLKQYKDVLDHMLPDVISIKVGAQVMLKANLDVSCGIVNGSRGVVIKASQQGFTVAFLRGIVIDFVTPYTRTFEDKQCKVSRTQFPFILAWGLTVHSCQGVTLDSAICNMGPDIFAEGQSYVSLSRIRTIKGLFVSDFHKDSIKVNSKASSFVKEIEKTAYFNE